MNLETFYRSQSAPIDLTIQDENGIAINIATFNDIWVVIYHKSARTEMASYQDTLGTILTINALAGEISVILENTDTEDAPTGIYSLDIRTSETDVLYAANTRYRAARIDIFELKDMEA